MTTCAATGCQHGLPPESRWQIIGESDHPDKVFCRCACGTERDVNKKNMERGLSLSCGCLTREISRQLRTTHGMSSSSENPHPLYGTWRGIIDRCSRPTLRSWGRYGGRGITVCEAWRASFTQFLTDVGEKPGPEYSLDRVDNDGNYEPGNVRWATASQQRQNQSPKTHCKHGHEFTPDNTVDRYDGRGRDCLICRQITSLSRSEKNRVACSCGHMAYTHRYMVTTGRNQGECLMAGCPCGGFIEEREG